ncbi:MAG: sugar phosphate isomerase/epimerase [Clostridia bacterium]|nr:sugar phosphate isomerase/epimerase [Clostridia bacterium]
MKIGMNLLLWTDEPSFDKHRRLVDNIKAIGFDGVELHVGLISIDECKRFGDYASSIGLETTALSVLSTEGNPVSPEKRMRDKSIDEFKACVDKTAALGATMLCGPFFQPLAYFSGARPTEDEWKWSIETARAFCAYAGSAGVEVAFEPLNRFELYLCNTLEKGVQYVKELGCENAGLLADTMHANIEELDVVKSVENALQYITHIHISENDRGIPGTGHAAPPELFTALKRGGYNRWLTIEAFNLGTPSLAGPLHLWRTFAPSDDELAKKGYEYIKSNI